MNIIHTAIDGLTEMTSPSIEDSRGSFRRIFCQDDFSQIRPNLHFCQINVSTTKLTGCIRGLHFQVTPSAEAKLIQCLKGRAFDVAVDIRRNSRTFLQWRATELTPHNNSIFIPEGFAHGFQALEDNTELLYFHTMPWCKANERGLRFDDPRLNIQWPLPVTEISEKDGNIPLIDRNFEGITL